MLFYGRMLNMGKKEILLTRYGEMLDMIACYAIFNGAKPKKEIKNKKWTFDEAVKLR